MSYGNTATGRFQPSSWQESVVVDIDGEGTTMGEIYFPTRGLTRSEVEFGYTGEIEGSSTSWSVTAYQPGDAPLMGFERFSGSIAGSEGTCVWRTTGSHRGLDVMMHLQVVEGLGTGALEGLRGEADVHLAGHSDDGYELVLHYDL